MVFFTWIGKVPENTNPQNEEKSNFFSSSDDESDWKLKNKMSNLANKIKSLKKKNNSEQDDPDSVEMKTNIAENQNQNDLESGLGKY